MIVDVVEHAVVVAGQEGAVGVGAAAKEPEPDLSLFTDEEPEALAVIHEKLSSGA